MLMTCCCVSPVSVRVCEHRGPFVWSTEPRSAFVKPSAFLSSLQGDESARLRYPARIATVAQLAEHLICNLEVTGSIPVGGFGGSISECVVQCRIPARRCELGRRRFSQPPVVQFGCTTLDEPLSMSMVGMSSRWREVNEKSCGKFGRMCIGGDDRGG
jgi:hypothetical protein